VRVSADVVFILNRIMPVDGASPEDSRGLLATGVSSERLDARHGLL
jgi:hypothetical protein